MNYYCMYQQVGNKKIIFGVGKNEREAIKDAKQYADHLNGLVLAKCTQKLYDDTMAGYTAHLVFRNDAGLIDMVRN